ncbi:MAG TPA: cysteine rich repeat-containing protein [Aquabacterium sp.]|nr:cysteine rich repeat-containing protein [Aquabacterium sp.]
MKKLHLSLFAATVMALPLSSMARPERQGPMQGACKADVEQFCKDVKPGEGRLAACLKEHKEEVSQPCKDAVKSAAEKRAQRRKSGSSN